jgi:hypothetical protein
MLVTSGGQASWETRPPVQSGSLEKVRVWLRQFRAVGVEGARAETFRAGWISTRHLMRGW